MKTRHETKRRNKCQSETTPAEKRDSETDIKTPKVKTRKSDQWIRTPGRDDIVFSQHFDSQTVIGWDCNSPDHVRGIKKISGEDGSDVTDLIKLIVDEDDETLQKSNTPPLLGVWRDSTGTEDKLLDNNLLPTKCRGRRRHRKKSGKDSLGLNDFYEKLTLALDKSKDVTKDGVDVSETRELCPANTDNVFETGVLDCSDDLFESDKEDRSKRAVSSDNKCGKSESVLNVLGKKPPVRVSPRQKVGKEKEQGGYRFSKENVCDNDNEFSCDKKLSDKFAKDSIGTKAGVDDAGIDGDEETWSDDELFEEDSFIVKATQIPEDVKIFVSPVFSIKRKHSNLGDQPKCKHSRFSFQLGDDNNNRDSQKFTTLQEKAKPSGNELVTTSAKVKPVCGTAQQKSSTGCKALPSASRSSLVNSNQLLGNRITRQTSGKCGPVGSNRNLSTRSSAPNSSSTAKIPQPICAKRVNISTGCAHKPLFNSTTVVSGNAISDTNCGSNSKVSVFRKHCSFSGPDSPKQGNLNTRKRSISGDFEKTTNVAGQTLQGSTVASTGTSKGYHTAHSVHKPPAVASGRGGTSKTWSSYSVARSSKCTQQANTGSVSTTVVTARPPSGPACTNSTMAKSSWARGSSNQSSEFKWGSKSKNATTSTNKQPINKNLGSRTVQRAATPGKSSDFDTSLTDDLLCQLAEPDELLESQVCPDPTLVTVNKSVSCSTPVIFAMSEPKQSTASAIVTSLGNSITTPCVTKTCGVGVSTQSRAAFPSQTFGQSRQFRFRTSQRSVPRTGAVPVPVCTQASRTATTVTVSSVNTRGGAHTTVQKAEQFSEDLFSEDEDDLLLDDDVLTEPQIMAMLDEVELMATQKNAFQNSQCSVTTVAVPAKAMCSKEQTNFARKQTCMENQACTGDVILGEGSKKQDLSGGQGNTNSSDLGQPSSQGHSSSQGQPCSQGTTSSQTKYSPEEIERKKQLALAKRKSRASQQIGSVKR